jgi:aspartate kinase
MNHLSIITDSNICKFTLHDLPDRPGIAAEMFGRLGDAGISVVGLAAAGAQLGRTDVSITVNSADAAKTAAVLDTARRELDAQGLSQKKDVAAVSLIADSLSHDPGVAARMFRTLSAEGINIDMITAGNTAVTCLIDSRFVPAAQRALEREFTGQLASR